MQKLVANLRVVLAAGQTSNCSDRRPRKPCRPYSNVCAWALAALALLRVADGAQAAGPAYSVTDLGTLGGGYIFVSGINNHGQIVGNSTTNGASVMHAFIYSNGVMTDLGTLGGTNSYGYGINDAGQVVGAAYTSNGESHAFLWSNGSMTDLGTLGGTGSDARGINNHGQIAGSSWTSNNVALHVCLFTATNKTDLGTLGGMRANSFSINDNGEIAGTSWPPGTNISHAFLYSGGVMSDLNPPGSTFSYGYGINNSAHVVGKSATTGVPEFAFLYYNGSTTNLGSLGIPSAVAYDVNNSDQVVGMATTSEGAGHAFLFSGGTMVDLNSLVDPNLGWNLEVASAINDYGQIVGVGTHPAMQLRAFLLNPQAQISLTPSNSVLIQFTAQANKGYIIEYRNSLTEGDWQVLAVLDPITIVHSVQFNDPIIAGRPARFYRVRPS